MANPSFFLSTVINIHDMIRTSKWSKMILFVHDTNHDDNMLFNVYNAINFSLLQHTKIVQIGLHKI